ncbi:MAG TPA: hypothetical protein VGC07_06710 [Granulicella sp.]
MTEFEGQVLTDLSVLKNQMQMILGIGQPGRITQLEERVERHEQAVQRMKGIAAVFGCMLTFAHLAITLLTRGH